jgi:Fis family transcriptional regulator, factor for inversion stimulation protein
MRRMSQPKPTHDIETPLRQRLRDYFSDLDGSKPVDMYEMVIQVVEKPLLEEVMSQANHNQSRAAQWLGLNRNTLRKKLLTHGLLDRE